MTADQDFMFVFALAGRYWNQNSIVWSGGLYLSQVQYRTCQTHVAELIVQAVLYNFCEFEILQKQKTEWV